MKMLKALLRWQHRPRLDTRGVVAVEFALLFPVLILMYLATVEVYIYYSYYFNVVKVAQITADFITRQNALSKSVMSGIFADAPLTMYPYDASKMQFSVVSVVPPEAAPTISWSCSGDASGKTAAGAGPLTAGAPYALPATGTNTSLLSFSPSFVAVTVNYPYSSLLPVKILGPITSTVYLTPRTKPQLPSPGC